MLFFRWIIGSLLLLSSLHIISLNGLVFWRSWIKREETPSWIPIVGGVLGAIALVILPVPNLHRWWCLPFLIDYGSILGIGYTLFWYIFIQKPRAK